MGAPSRPLVLAALLALAVLLVMAALAARDTRVAEAYTDEENDAWLEARLAELREHLAGTDPDLAEAAARVSDVHVLRDANPRKLPNGKVGFNSGRFKHSTGELSVGGYDGHGRERTRGAMLMTLLHEVAHAHIGPTDPAQGSPHGDEWNRAWRRLLRHATSGLGWEVEVRCAECTYYNLCGKSQCPECTWLQATCAPYQGGSPSDFKRRERAAAAAAAAAAGRGD